MAILRRRVMGRDLIVKLILENVVWLEKSKMPIIVSQNKEAWEVLYVMNTLKQTSVTPSQLNKML